MCTLIVLWRAFDGHPLIVAANRDEKLDRAAGPPSVRVHAGRPFVAPTDLSAGGTWLGINDADTFVGITNRFNVRKPGPLRSRGLLVVDALAAGSAEEIDYAFTAMDPARYDGFHLVVADRRAGVILWNDGERVHRAPLTPGGTIVTERSFGAGATRRVELIEERLAELQDPSDEALIELLSTRAEDGFEGVNVSVPAHGYGTRSSTIILFTDDSIRMLHADGPPDRAPFLDQGHLLAELKSRDRDPSRPRTTSR